MEEKVFFFKIGVAMLVWTKTMRARKESRGALDRFNLSGKRRETGTERFCGREQEPAKLTLEHGL